MTATPIPRTLGQVLYADLDVSDLRTPPAGRVPIRTGVKRPADLDGTWHKVREEAALGHRTFVVVPLIEEGATRATAPVAAESEAVRLPALLDPLRVGHGPRPPQAGRARRRDDPLPRRGARRPGRHHRGRGRRRRAGRDDDGHRGCRPVRSRPAPPAPGPGRTRHRRVVLRARHRLDRRGGHGAPAGGRRDPTTGSSWPRRTSSCARRATCWVLPRAASRGCASRRSRSRRIASWPSAPASHAEALLDADGRMAPPRPALTAELEHGWLRASPRPSRRAA